MIWKRWEPIENAISRQEWKELEELEKKSKYFTIYSNGIKYNGPYKYFKRRSEAFISSLKSEKNKLFRNINERLKKENRTIEDLFFWQGFFRKYPLPQEAPNPKKPSVSPTTPETLLQRETAQTQEQKQPPGETALTRPETLLQRETAQTQEQKQPLDPEEYFLPQTTRESSKKWKYLIKGFVVGGLLITAAALAPMVYSYYNPPSSEKERPDNGHEQNNAPEYKNLSKVEFLKKNQTTVKEIFGDDGFEKLKKYLDDNVTNKEMYSTILTYFPSNGSIEMEIYDENKKLIETLNKTTQPEQARDLLRNFTKTVESNYGGFTPDKASGLNKTQVKEMIGFLVKNYPSWTLDNKSAYISRLINEGILSNQIITDLNNGNISSITFIDTQDSELYSSLAVINYTNGNLAISKYDQSKTIEWDKILDSKPSYDNEKSTEINDNTYHNNIDAADASENINLDKINHKTKVIKKIYRIAKETGLDFGYKHGKLIYRGPPKNFDDQFGELLVQCLENEVISKHLYQIHPSLDDFSNDILDHKKYLKTKKDKRDLYEI